MFEVTSLAAKGLRLQGVLAEEVLSARGEGFENPGHKKRNEILSTSANGNQISSWKKIQKYAPILAALQYYIHAGWTIEILPWVVGIQGFADTKHLHAALAFLDIPRPKWKDMTEDSVLA